MACSLSSRFPFLNNFQTHLKISLYLFDQVRSTQERCRFERRNSDYWKLNLGQVLRCTCKVLLLVILFIYLFIFNYTVNFCSTRQRPLFEDSFTLVIQSHISEPVFLPEVTVLRTSMQHTPSPPSSTSPPPFSHHLPSSSSPPLSSCVIYWIQKNM